MSIRPQIMLINHNICGGIRNTKHWISGLGLYWRNLNVNYSISTQTSAVVPNCQQSTGEHDSVNLNFTKENLALGSRNTVMYWFISIITSSTNVMDLTTVICKLDILNDQKIYKLMLDCSPLGLFIQGALDLFSVDSYRIRCYDWPTFLPVYAVSL